MLNRFIPNMVSWSLKLVAHLRNHCDSMHLRRLMKISDSRHTEARPYPTKPDECGMLEAKKSANPLPDPPIFEWSLAIS
jgi:hypothetical protein